MQEHHALTASLRLGQHRHCGVERSIASQFRPWRCISAPLFTLWESEVGWSVDVAPSEGFRCELTGSGLGHHLSH